MATFVAIVMSSSVDIHRRTVLLLCFEGKVDLGESRGWRSGKSGGRRNYSQDAIYERRNKRKNMRRKMRRKRRRRKKRKRRKKKEKKGGGEGRKKRRRKGGGGGGRRGITQKIEGRR